MYKDIYLSYSRKNVEAARKLYRDLTIIGYKVWMDEEDLLPGQDWDNEIEKVINNAQVAIVCISSKWINEKGYIQKELKIIKQVSDEFPENKVFIIPVKIDNCDPPQFLKKIQWVNLYESKGFDKLQKAVSFLLEQNSTETDKIIIKSIDAYTEFMETAIEEGALIHEDPWTIWHSDEERIFKKLLKGRVDKSLDLLEIEKYEKIIELWEPLSQISFFVVDNPEWSDKPFFRSQIHSAKCQLFISYIKVNSKTPSGEIVRKILDILEELLKVNPYSLKGASVDRLPIEEAKIHNLNYKDTLQFANSWIYHWKSLFKVCGISESQLDNIKQKIHNRIYEIDYLLNLRNISG